MRWLFALPLLLLTGLFFAVTDTRPSVWRTLQVSLADLDRGKAIVDSLGLRRMQEGEVRQLVLSESDLDQGVNYLAHRLVGGSASARIVLSRLTVRASLPLPLPGTRRCVNLELALAPGGEVLQAAQLRLGKLALPANLADELVVWSLAHSPYAEELAAARAMLDSARLSGQNLAMRFTWHGAALERVMDSVAAHGVDEATLTVYRNRMRQAGSRDFAVLLGEAFALAQARSVGNDPVMENRAALTGLAESVMGGRLLSRRGIVDSERHTGIRLSGREDLSQHFALSALLAATGGAGLSDLAGLHKELKDAQHGGSGFSFTDLAADRAGSRLGEASTRSRAAALRLQKRLAGVRDAKVFLPAVGDLPEFMHQAEFQRRFGGIGQAAYRRMVARIEARIAEMALYKD